MEDETEWSGHSALLDDPDERRVLFGALDSFYQYRRHCHQTVTHVRRQAFYALPATHWKRLAAPPISYLATLDAVDDAIDTNAEIAGAILAAGLRTLGLPPEPVEPYDWRGAATVNDLDKARTTIRQFYRDWSADGASERAAHFTPVVDALCAEFPSFRDTTHVLVPGAGLGRLLHSICAAGFAATGNELSHHALLASTWVLNHTVAGHHFPLHPFALSFANHATRENQLRRVLVPDIHPGSTLAESAAPRAVHPFERLGMAAGDFVSSYSDADSAGSFNAVATVFFLDTAPNVLRYIETVRHVLAPGGVWVNFGPLLWHFAPGEKIPPFPSATVRDGESERGVHEPGSVELADDEVRALVERCGFAIERHGLCTGDETSAAGEAGYIADSRSMLHSVYRPSSWIARRTV
ncbi:MAG: hypothetical protein M1832_001095 [Thelocarpon impressellum]|nr:MAG: hypothetical protein M1832_001095 [Thelocarpon impressellum]